MFYPSVNSTQQLTGAATSAATLLTAAARGNAIRLHNTHDTLAINVELGDSTVVASATTSMKLPPGHVMIVGRAPWQTYIAIIGNGATLNVTQGNEI